VCEAVRILVSFILVAIVLLVALLVPIGAFTVTPIF
jgi:hypothetical protein